MWHLKNEKNASHSDWSSLFPVLRKAVCAAPHNGFSHQKCGGWPGWAWGWQPLPTHSSLRAFLSSCRAGERKMTHFLLLFWDWPRFTYSPSQWQLRESGSRKCRHIFALGLFRREAKHWACSFFLRFDALLCTRFSAHFGERGWLCCNGLNIPCIKRGEIYFYEFWNLL